MQACHYSINLKVQLWLIGSWNEFKCKCWPVGGEKWNSWALSQVCLYFCLIRKWKWPLLTRHISVVWMNEWRTCESVRNLSVLNFEHLSTDWPKVSWARAKVRLRGDRTTFGCCGPTGSFSRNCKPRRSMAPPIALCSSGLNARPPTQLWTSSFSSSSTGLEPSGAPGLGSSWRQEWHY